MSLQCSKEINTFTEQVLCAKCFHSLKLNCPTAHHLLPFLLPQADEESEAWKVKLLVLSLSISHLALFRKAWIFEASSLSLLVEVAYRLIDDKWYYYTCHQSLLSCWSSNKIHHHY